MNETLPVRVDRMQRTVKAFILICAAAITVMAGGALYAGEEPLTVLGDRVDAAEERERQPGFVDIIEVAAQGTRVATIAGVLSRRAGIQVKNYGGVGGRSYLSTVSYTHLRAHET